MAHGNGVGFFFIDSNNASNCVNIMAPATPSVMASLIGSAVAPALWPSKQHGGYNNSKYARKSGLSIIASAMASMVWHQHCAGITVMPLSYCSVTAVSITELTHMNVSKTNFAISLTNFL